MQNCGRIKITGDQNDCEWFGMSMAPIEQIDLPEEYLQQMCLLVVGEMIDDCISPFEHSYNPVIHVVFSTRGPRSFFSNGDLHVTVGDLWIHDWIAKHE